jgi:aspartate carbamoyltransferase catalytic subunit
MNILTASQFDQAKLTRIFATADKIRSSPGRWHGEVSDKLLGSVFFEPSTRTRLSFEAAMVRLGGQVISVENANLNSSKAKGESLEDTVQTLSQYVDCIVIRHPEEGAIQQAACASDVPVINGGDWANEHPTQALLDLYTIVHEKYWPERLKIMFTGDLLCSRTAQPFIKILLRYDVDIYVTSQIPTICSNKIKTISEGDIGECLRDIDVLYMTRHQWERSKEREVSEFVLTPALVETMKKDAIILHPLPRTKELPKSIDNYPQAVYLKKQVKNGMWVRMALLYELLTEKSLG